MKIIADDRCYLTEVADIALDKRTFRKMVILSSNEESSNWKQITEEEKASLEAHAALFANQEITPDYLQKVNVLLSGIEENINNVNLTAEEALDNKSFFPVFDKIIGRNINAGFRFNEGEDLYEALVPHMVLEENRPTVKPMLLNSATGVAEIQLYKIVTKD